MVFIAKGAAAAFSFALNWLIARQFGPEGVGNFAVALTSAVLGATLALMGLEYVLVRIVAIEHGTDGRGVARTAVGRSLRRAGFLALAIALGLFLARDSIADHLIGEPGVAPFLGVMAIAIPILASIKLASAALRGAGRVAISQWIDGPIGTGIAATSLGVLILAGMASAPLLPAVLYCLSAGFAALVGWTVLRPLMRSWGPAEPLAEPLFRAGIPILCITISNLFVDWFATLFLISAWGPSEAGLFRIAFQIIMALNLFMVAIEAALGPMIARSYAEGDRARIATVARKSIFMLLLISSPLLITILVVPEWILALFGPEFVAASPALRILALGQIVSLATGPVGVILLMTKHERWSLAHALIGAVVGGLLCWFLIPDLGMIGAALAIMAAVISRRLAAYLIVRNVIGIHFFRRGPA